MNLLESQYDGDKEPDVMKQLLYFKTGDRYAQFPKYYKSFLEQDKQYSLKTLLRQQEESEEEDKGKDIAGGHSKYYEKRGKRGKSLGG